ncbi:MAG TPA: Gfo/Idh/MocA family oxidoreductase [Mycobacteriales bacterium]|nr:Gfo/Idh/MocA family oxidoreductase [Mycobacteriales bacterium]
MGGLIGVGIIGMGAIGRTHARVVDSIPGARVTAVATSGKAGFGHVEGVDDTVWHGAAESLVSRPDVDIVAVCSPSAEHARHAMLAVEAGRHVVVEKPPAGTGAELGRLADRARDRGVQVSVVSQLRLLPHPRHVAALLHSGRLGRPLLGEIRLHWHRAQSYYDAAPWRSSDPHAGSLPNQGWHALDLVSWFFGPVESVCAMSATLAHRIEVEDTTCASLRFRNGALGSVVTTTATPPGRPSTIALFTELGSLTIRDSTVGRWDVRDDIPPPPAEAETGSGAADPALIGTAGHRAYWCDLFDAVHSGRAPTVTAADGAATVALIEAIYESARTGAAVTPRQEVTR